MEPEDLCRSVNCSVCVAPEFSLLSDDGDETDGTLTDLRLFEGNAVFGASLSFIA
jgi:hypothetical protein